jgi:tRNA-2-methylthio-N6-dimethylallyladenosine synthase
MNNADSDIVRAVLAQNGYGVAEGDDDADVVLLNTCAIREKVTQHNYRLVSSVAWLVVVPDLRCSLTLTIE